MQRTRIEWVKNEDGSQGYTLNPIKGLCPVDCKDNQGKSYCYARAMYKRFRWNPEIRWGCGEIDKLATIQNPSRIFWGSTMELFGDWIEPSWMKAILHFAETYSRHTHIFLTKQPQNLIKWSPFPDNCQVGVSVCTDVMMTPAIAAIDEIEAKIKYISFEPLLSYINPQAIEAACSYRWLDWVIIGAQSPYNKKTFPKWEWIREIIDACDKASIPIFLKNNLGLEKYSCEGGMPFYKKHSSGTMELRQEIPDNSLYYG